MSFSIGEVARLAGCSAPTIRYYESLGLIPSPMRTGGGRRSFGWPDVKRLQFIRRSRDYGLSIGQIRELTVAAADDAACAKARVIVQQRIEELRARMLDMARLQASLEVMARQCDAGCGQNKAMPCSIFDDLAGENAA